MSCAICSSRWPNADRGYATPAAGRYCCGLAARSTLSASNISAPLPCTRSAFPVRYSASSRRSASLPLLRMENASIDVIATTGARPPRMRGVCAVIDTARNGGGGAPGTHASHVPSTAR